MLSEQEPPQPEENPLFLHVGKLDSLRLELFDVATTYASTPKDNLIEKMGSVATMMAEHYDAVLDLIFKLDATDLEKLSLVLNLLKNEDKERFDNLNRIAGHEVVQPFDFSDFEKSIDLFSEKSSEQILDYTTLQQDQLTTFGTGLTTDLNMFVNYINQLHNTPYRRYKKAAIGNTVDIAKIAGGVAIGILIAKRFER